MSERTIRARKTSAGVVLPRCYDQGGSQCTVKVGLMVTFAPHASADGLTRRPRCSCSLTVRSPSPRTFGRRLWPPRMDQSVTTSGSAPLITRMPCNFLFASDEARGISSLPVGSPGSSSKLAAPVLPQPAGGPAACITST